MINTPTLNALRRMAALLVLLAVSSLAEDGAAPSAKDVAVGDRAPLFTLKDQNDQEFSLDAMIKNGPVAVVFIRSIEWCTYCQLQTVQLSQHFTEIQAGGGGTWASLATVHSNTVAAPSESWASTRKLTSIPPRLMVVPDVVLIVSSLVS